MRRFSIFLTSLLVLLLSQKIHGQCDGGNLNSTITPTSSIQSVGLSNGDYFTINVSCGSTYHFYTDASWDTQLTINQTDGTTSLAYDDDGGSGTLSDLSWTSNFTGTIHVLVSQYSCNHDGSNTGDLYYTITSSVPSTDFSSSTTSCSTATSTVVGMQGGTFSFNPSPGDGANINSSNGSVSNGVAGTTYTIQYEVCGSFSSTNDITMPGAINTFDYELTNCDEATPVQTEGETGGSFSWTSNPGGGTQINSGTGIITNADPGDSYSIDYDVCGITTTFNYTVPTDLADFNMIEVCGGGVPDIYGVTGGIFSFSPNPSDGSQISSVNGVVSNGVVGETYTIEYTVCGVSTTSPITITSNNCFSMNGDAQQVIVDGESCIQLTDEVNNQTGCAWNGTTINFDYNFSLSLDYYFGDNIGGADGNTFTFQPSSSAGCGNNGGQLGAGGISNALSIEFDTYDNDNPSHIYDRLCDHVAIEVDGDHMNGPPAAGPQCAKSDGGNIDDGGTYEVEIDWNASSQTLTVYFDGAAVLSYSDDLVNNVFGGVSEVYWGATSATGGLNNQQYFCPSTIVILANEAIDLTASCENDHPILKWEKEDEENVIQYQIEYSKDGFVYLPYSTIDAGSRNYSLDARAIPNNSLVRVKQINLDGEKYTSHPIFWVGCSSENNQFTIYNGEQLVIQGDSDIKYQASIYTSAGSLVSTEIAKNGLILFQNDIAQGVYIVHIKDANDKITTKKVFIH